MPDIESMRPEDFEALSADDMDAMAQQLSDPSADEVQPVADAAETDSAADGASAPEAAQQEETGARRGDPEVPLRELRERQRQLEAQHQQAMAENAQLKAILQQGQQPRPVAPVAAPPPDPDLDPHGFAQWHAQQVAAPLAARLQQLEAANQQAQRQIGIAQLSQQHPTVNVAGIVQHFDNTFPHLAGVPDEMKVLAAIGATNSGPGAKERFQEAVKGEAVKQGTQLAQDALAAAQGGKPKGGPTLGRTPSASSADDLPVDVSKMGPRDFSRLSVEQMRKLQSKF